MAIYDFKEIYEMYQPRVHRYLIGMLGVDDAEDLVQEVFIKVYNSLHTFRSESKLSTWIYAIAKNIVIDQARKNSIIKKKVNVNASLFDDNDLYYFNDNVKGSVVENCFIESETCGCIQKVIDKLPLRYREIILLSEISALSNREISEKFNISINSAKISLHRARKRLKDEFLQNCCFTYDEQNNYICEPKSDFLL